jgi:hypothetical protein
LARFVVPLKVAEIRTDRELTTALVVTTNEAVVAPDATVTLAGTCAAVLLLVRATTAPPAGAGPVRTTVPVEGFPPITAVGFRLREAKAAAVTVNVRVRVMPL